MPPARRRARRRNTQTASIASAAIIRRFAITPASAPPSPKCDSSAAMPSPAARPAIGPSQRLGDGWGVAAGGVAGVACCVRDGDVGWTGVLCWRWIDCDCRPKLRPPPSRAASASFDATTPIVSTAAMASTTTRFRETHPNTRLNRFDCGLSIKPPCEVTDWNSTVLTTTGSGRLQLLRPSHARAHRSLLKFTLQLSTIGRSSSFHHLAAVPRSGSRCSVEPDGHARSGRWACQRCASGA